MDHATLRLRGLVALALLALAAPLSAQNSANAGVSATVLTPLVVSKTTDLEFGNVFPGLNKTVAVTDAGAASFSIVGQPSANIHLTFTLPSTLSSGGNTMPIASWTGRSNTTASPASGTDFTPSASNTASTLPAVTGTRYVYIGATAQPGVAQVAGTYTGTLTMTVVYY